MQVEAESNYYNYYCFVDCTMFSVLSFLRIYFLGFDQKVDTLIGLDNAIINHNKSPKLELDKLSVSLSMIRLDDY